MKQTASEHPNDIPFLLHKRAVKDLKTKIAVDLHDPFHFDEHPDIYQRIDTVFDDIGM